VFDVLRLHGRDVTDRPLSKRRELLEELFAPIPAAGVLALSMHTREESQARAWYESMHPAGVEGLVIKPVRSRYEMGVRGWQKYKYRSSTEAIVSGYLGPSQRPDGLLLGRYDDTERLRVVGRTTRLSIQAAAQIAPLLTPALGDHPWPGDSAARLGRQPLPPARWPTPPPSGDGTGTR
jgi:ATP-dependent DNA ligase